jgi:protein-tyrosine-phosphatase
MKTDWFTEVLANEVLRIERAFDRIDPKRRALLNGYAAEIHPAEGLPFVFICTHNSRRSQFAQVWARVAALHYGVSGLYTFSGGTEVTAVARPVVDCLRAQGFEISVNHDGSANPEYTVELTDREREILCSKRFDDPSQPDNGFIAVMTCTDADEGCPFIPGATHRWSLPFDDPKSSDGTAHEAQAYRTASDTIARELFYLFSRFSR